MSLAAFLVSMSGLFGLNVESCMASPAAEHPRSYMRQWRRGEDIASGSLLLGSRNGVHGAWSIGKKYGRSYPFLLCCVGRDWAGLSAVAHAGARSAWSMGCCTNRWVMGYGFFFMWCVGRTEGDCVTGRGMMAMR